MRKKISLILITLGLFAGGVGYYGYHRLNDLLSHSIKLTSSPLLIVEKGTSSQKLAEQLAKQGVISENEATLLPYMLRLNPALNKFKAGVYSLEKVATIKDLLTQLNSGKEVQLNVKFIEGKTFKTWREQLAKADYLTQTLTDKSEAEIAELLGLEQQKVEGWIAPNTYNYVPYSTDLELLKRAYQQQQKILAQAWQTRAENLPLANPYQMLILASIVEKETGIASERPQVASVFINRLKLKMKLQTDPTVIYGMGERYDGNIRKKDLQEATLYNTYVIEGLPPTPIAMPSRASIDAVAHPDNTPYLYFVANGTGGHTFSKTLDEHNQAVREWIKIEREKKSAKGTQQ